MYIYLLDITKRQCCIEWFVSGLYNYTVRTFVVVNYIDIQQISCSAQTGAAFALAGLMLSFLGTATTMYIYMCVCMYRIQLMYVHVYMYLLTRFSCIPS